jgi:hypothetical protein
MSKNMREALTETERQRVDELLGSMTRKPADEYMAGEFIHVQGTERVSSSRRVPNGIYCVKDWRGDRLVLIRYGTKTTVEVPFTHEGGEPRAFTKYPLELVVLSERVKARQEAGI